VVDAGMAGVHFHGPLDLSQGVGPQACFEEAGDVLEFAGPVGVAMPAIDVMGGEQQAQSGTLQAAHGRRIRPYLQAGGDVDGAGRHRRPLDLHKAKPARGFRTTVLFHKAEVRNIDVVFQADGKQIPALPGGDLPIVHLQCHHRRFPPGAHY